MLVHYRTIQTTYYGPGNVRGSRIIAKGSDDAGKGPKLVMHYDHALGVDENHAKAAKLLAEKLGWVGRWVMGGLPRGAVFVLVDGADGFSVAERER